MNRHDDDLTANNSKKRKLGDDDELSDMYLARLDAFRKSDQDRNDMVQELIIKYNNLKQLYEHKEAEYESERETRLMWQKTAKEHDSELRQLKLVTESNSFVYAAIDGDGAYFKDDFIAQGQDGGSQAAYQLRADIKSYLQRQYPAANVEDWRIIVQVFLGADGLNKKLRNCGIIRDPQNSVTSFGIGFGLSQPLFSFVDVGYGKERADHKITEMMRAMIRLHQCKHLFFGPCNDNGYLNFLEEYKRDDAVAKKLTLIETQAAQRGFTALGLSRISFPAVFRSEPLPDSQPRPVANGAYANPAPASLPFSTITANSRERRATVAETGSPQDAYAAPAMERDPDEKYILLNADRDRVDERLRPADPMAEASYKEKTRRQGRNFCNFYHLNGFCVNGSRCRHEHGEPLEGEEKLYQRHMSRGNPCNAMQSCRRFDCVNGHHCRNIYDGGYCPAGEQCKFKNTHDMDVTPATKLYDDYREEVLGPKELLSGPKDVKRLFSL